MLISKEIKIDKIWEVNWKKDILQIASNNTKFKEVEIDKSK